MKIFHSKNNVSLGEIKKYYTEELIMEYYGIPLDSYFCNPFREDNNPSCTCTYYNGKLVFRDWTMEKSYDIISTAALYYEIIDLYDDNDLSGEDYLNTIKCMYFDLIECQSVTFLNSLKKDREVEVKANKVVDIQVNIRDWKSYDIDYWSPLNVFEFKDLKTPIYPLNYAILNGNRIAINKDNNPTYGYFFKEHSIKGKEIWKIYKPLDKKHKWLANIKQTMISYGY